MLNLKKYASVELCELADKFGFVFESPGFYWKLKPISSEKNDGDFDIVWGMFNSNIILGAAKLYDLLDFVREVYNVHCQIEAYGIDKWTYTNYYVNLPEDLLDEENVAYDTFEEALEEALKDAFNILLILQDRETCEN